MNRRGIMVIKRYVKGIAFVLLILSVVGIVLAQGATFSISGFKINAADGSGIADWTINLKNATNDTVIATTTTDATGAYQFQNLENGSYNVTEDIRAGWTNNGSIFHLITIDGQDVTNQNFTNTEVTQPASAPVIIGSAPPSSVRNNVNQSRTFNITVDQTVNVIWLINGNQTFTNTGVTEASYTNTSAVLGI